MTPNSRTAHIGSLYVGPYADERTGAAVMIGDQIAHLSVAQCHQLIAKVNACLPARQEGQP